MKAFKSIMSKAKYGVSKMFREGPLGKFFRTR